MMTFGNQCQNPTKARLQMSVIDCSKCIHFEVCGNRYANDGCAGECSYFLEHNPTGDCISREALKEKAIWTKVNNGAELIDIEVVPLDAIDNAPPVEAFTKEDMAGAYNEGYACGGRESKRPNEQIAWEQGYEAGLAQGKQDRPKGEWINREAISNTIFPFWERYECNQCHKFNGYSNFCPNCGADMRKGDAE